MDLWNVGILPQHYKALLPTRNRHGTYKKFETIKKVVTKYILMQEQEGPTLKISQEIVYKMFQFKREDCDMREVINNIKVMKDFFVYNRVSRLGRSIRCVYFQQVRN
jgi:hypothetical protein